jgi:hypothetical protein
MVAITGMVCNEAAGLEEDRECVPSFLWQHYSNARNLNRPMDKIRRGVLLRCGV